MRTAALILLFFVAFGYAAKSQRFSLLPQVGFENSKTKVSYNGSSFAPLGVKFSPQASLRLNYASKPGHGFFVGLATSRSTVSFSFTDPETGMNNFAATTGNMQVRLEGGYQFNSKPIPLGKSKQTASNSKSNSQSTGKSGNHSYSGHSCCHRSYSSCGSSNKNKESRKSKGTWVRIQPSIGMGYIPFVQNDVVTKSQGGQTVYEYRAGNWNTALLAGAGFEFGKKNARLFTVSFNYFKGLGNLGSETISSQSGPKTVTTTLQSSVSGWDMRIGIPFTLKKSSPKNKKTESHQYKSPCGQYRVIYRCGNK